MQKQFTLFMFLGFIGFLLIFVFTLFVLNPEKGAYALVPFFVSLTFMLLCFFSLASYLFRKKATNNEIYFTNVKISLREGFIFAVYIDVILALGALRLLTWWDGLLLGASLILLEMYFLAGPATSNHPKNEERIL